MFVQKPYNDQRSKWHNALREERHDYFAYQHMSGHGV